MDRSTASPQAASAPQRRDATAYNQVVLLSTVFFCCPGLYNVLSSIAGGLQDPTLAFRGNVLIYACFAVSSVLAAALVPSMGLRQSLTLGTGGYVVYAASLWNLSSGQLPSAEAAIVVFYVASVALGVSAGFLWTAQGQMIMSYATERNQGRYLSTFWIIFNLGATAGGLLTCGLNWNAETVADTRQAVSDITFLAFIALTSVGTVLSVMCIASPSQVIKEDGSRVVFETGHKHEPGRDWRRDAVDLAKYLFTSREILLLLPFFAYSNWFYTYHSFFNVSVFNTRSSGLASACYWTAQMLAAHWIGKILDKASAESANSSSSSFSSSAARRRHAWIVLAGLTVLWNLMWASGWYAQVSLQLSYDAPLQLDLIRNPIKSLGPLTLYCVYGAADALGQVWIYWYLSSVCPSGRDLRVAGFNAGLYKSIQSLTAALSWYIGAQRLAPVSQVWINWILSDLALLGAMLSMRTAHTSTEGHGEQELVERGALYKKPQHYQSVDTTI